ncbi:MAG: hypothetical protein K0Q60_3155, partial [Microvirga sp.]|nr:hypothetical protein [Microvirga sp.]
LVRGPSFEGGLIFSLGFIMRNLNLGQHCSGFDIWDRKS